MYRYFLVVIVISALRFLGDWMLSGAETTHSFVVFFGRTAFYWHVLFLHALVFRVVAHQPLRGASSWACTLIALQAAAPFLDAPIYGPGTFGYTYLRELPDAWFFGFVNADQRYPAGQAVLIWASIVTGSVLTARRTRSAARAGLAGLAIYGVWLLALGYFPAAAAMLGERFPEGGAHDWVFLTAGQLLVGVMAIFAPRPKLVWHLIRRANHAVPFILMSLLGAAFAGSLSTTAVIYAGLLLLTFITALAQNDLHDVAEDTLQGRPRIVSGDDVAFLNVTLVLLITTLLLAWSLVGALLLVVLVLSYLYSYPFYRGKAFFPANLKMEGAWGLASFLVGIFAYFEHAAYGGPAWFIEGTQPVSKILHFTNEMVIASVLVFGGYSLVAMLKDYKDWQADLRAGVQTLYTLAKRREWNFVGLHRTVVALACLCLFLPLPLLTASGRLPLALWPPALLFVGLVAALMLGPATRARFAGVLLSINGYFAYLLGSLHFTA